MPNVILARIEEPVSVGRIGYPVTHGCPFPQGALTDARLVRLCREDGGRLPLQTRVLAAWPDGSIKWLLLDTQVSLRPREILPLRIEYGEGINSDPLVTALGVRETSCGLHIETGALTMELRREGVRPVAQASGCLREGGPPQLTLMDAAGIVYTGQVETLEIEERNALRLVVRATGGYVGADGARPMSWIVRLYFFAGQPFAKLYHTFVHDQDEPLLFRMRELKLAFPLALDGPARVMTGTPHWTVHLGDDWGEMLERLSFWEHDLDQYSIFGTPQGRVDRRTRSHGWIYVGDGQRGAQIKLRNPGQQYPKLYAASADSIEIHLFPDRSNWSEPPDAPRTYTQLDMVHDGEYEGPLQVPQGMAKTHELYVHFGPSALDLVDCASWAAAWQHPLLLEIGAQAYADSGALGTMARYYPEYWRLEEKLRQGSRGADLVGMMNFGDTGRVATENGKQVTYTVDNVSYDHTRSVIRQYMRRGDQPTFWTAEAMAFHLMDVDTIHHSSEHPERVGAPHMQWSQFHHYSNTSRTALSHPNTSHTWLGGLLDYYYLTGYRRAFEVAQATGRYCARTPSQDWEMTPQIRASWDDPRVPWPYCPRTSGWALNGMCELYEAMPDPKLEGPMRKMVDLFESWQDEDGRWRNTIGSFGRGATGFMIAGVLNGLMRVWELLGEQRARTMCIKGCRFLATALLTKEGLMYYKELPICRTGAHGSNVLTFRPMVFAYAQTGDRAILQAIWRLFRVSMDGTGPHGYEIKDVLWALPTFERAGLLELWRNEQLP